MNHNQFNRPTSPENQSTQDNPNSWDSLGDAVGFNPQAAAARRADAMLIQPPESATQNAAANFSEKERQRRLRQKDKLMHAILDGTGALDSHNTTPPRKLSPADQQQVYNLFNNGQITPNYESNVLRHLALPIGAHGEKSAQVLNSLDTKHTRRILANFSHRGFDQWQSTNLDDLQDFFAAYPTPVEFGPAAEQFMDQIRRGNSAQKAKSYADALQDFQHKVYGKRQEYHEAFSELRADAMASEMAQQSVAGHHQTEQEASRPERANAIVFGPVENIGDEGGFMRRRITLEPGQTPPAGSTPLSEAPLSTPASETPLEDSLHYMSPEVAARYKHLQNPRQAENQSIDQSRNQPSTSQPNSQPSNGSSASKSGLFGRLFGRKS